MTPTQKTPRAVSPTKYVVARAADLDDGGRLLVTVGGREIGVFKVKGEFFALLDRCPHLGGPLCKGQLLNTVSSDGPGDVRLDTDDDLITCPWHGWEFDIRTGKSYWNPEHLKARRFPVGVEPGEALAVYLETGEAERIPGPYQAEVIPVSIEDDYVVVEMRGVRPTARLIPPAAGSASPRNPVSTEGKEPS